MDSHARAVAVVASFKRSPMPKRRCLLHWGVPLAAAFRENNLLRFEAKFKQQQTDYFITQAQL